MSRDRDPFRIPSAGLEAAPAAGMASLDLFHACWDGLDAVQQAELLAGTSLSPQSIEDAAGGRAAVSPPSAICYCVCDWPSFGVFAMLTFMCTSVTCLQMYLGVGSIITQTRDLLIYRSLGDDIVQICTKSGPVFRCATFAQLAMEAAKRRYDQFER